MPTLCPWISFTEACENADAWERMSFLLGDGAHGRDWFLGTLGDFSIEPAVPGSVGMAGEECKSSDRYWNHEGLCNVGLLKVCFLNLYACLFSRAIFLNLRTYLILIYNIKTKNSVFSSAIAQGTLLSLLSPPKFLHALQHWDLLMKKGQPFILPIMSLLEQLMY